MVKEKWEKPVEYETCFSYTYDDVEDQPFVDIFVRSQSRKGVIDLNKKIVAFLLHKGSLYSWQKNQNKIKLLS